MSETTQEQIVKLFADIKTLQARSAVMDGLLINLIKEAPQEFLARQAITFKKLKNEDPVAGNTDVGSRIFTKAWLNTLDELEAIILETLRNKREQSSTYL